MKIFSDNFKERLEYSKNNSVNINEYLENLNIIEWPGYWWGALNPWLCYFLPSPGDSKIITDYRQYKEPSVGEPNKHFKKQNDSTNFWSTLRSWTVNSFIQSEMVNNEDDALAMSLVANIVTTRSGEAKKIVNEVIENIPDKFDILMKLNPKVIICGTNDIYNNLMTYIKYKKCEIEKNNKILVPTRNQKAEYYTTYETYIKINNSKIIIGKFPQHPSRKNFIESKDVVEYISKITH